MTKVNVSIKDDVMWGSGVLKQKALEQVYPSETHPVSRGYQDWEVSFTENYVVVSKFEYSSRHSLTKES